MYTAFRYQHLQLVYKGLIELIQERRVEHLGCRKLHNFAMNNLFF